MKCKKARHPMRDFDRLPPELRQWVAGAKLPWRAASKKVNVGGSRPKADSLDAETLALIREYNATDAALHELVS